MDEKEIEKIKKELYNDAVENGEKVQDIKYFDELELLKSDDKFLGWEAKDAFVIEKVEEKDGKETTTYDIYNKKGELIAISDEQGNLEFTPEYKEKLSKMPKELYDKIGFDKRKVKVEELEKDSKEREKNKKTVNKKSENKKDKKNSKKQEEVPEKEEEKVEKMEEDLGINSKDIKSSSEIKDEEFYKLVPEAKQCKGKVSIVYIGSKNEFAVVGVNEKTGKYEPLKTVMPSQAVEQKSSIDISRTGEKVERKSLKAVLKIKGEEEYSFSTKFENGEPIEFKELRKDLQTGEYISRNMQTFHQYPVTKEVEKMMKKEENKDIKDEVKKYRNKEIEQNSEITTNIYEIKDDSKKTVDDKKEQAKRQEEEYEKSIWEKPPHERRY